MEFFREQECTIDCIFIGKYNAHVIRDLLNNRVLNFVLYTLVLLQLIKILYRLIR